MKKVHNSIRTKRIVCLMLSVILLVCLLSACGGDSATHEEMKMSSSSAVYDAKESKDVQNKLASEAYLEWYSIDWGTCDATKVDEYTFNVELNGNISGYSDQQKMNYHGKKGFTVTATVSGTFDSNTVSDIRIRWS